MKVYKVIYLLITLIFTGVFTSCNDLLDVESVNKISPEGFITNSSTKENAIAAAYLLTYRAVTQNGAWAYYGDVRTGLCIANGNDYSIFKNQDLLVNNSRMEMLRDWNRFYDAIAQCNYVIEELDNVHSKFISVEEKEQGLGEVLYLRAYLYYYLTRIWGDVPVVLKAGADEPVSANSVSDVLSQVTTDLELAETYLIEFFITENSEVDLGTSRRRVTHAAALALLTRVCMENGDANNGILWFEKFESLNDSIDALDFDLERVSSINKIYSGSSKENIFGFKNTTDFYAENYNPYIKSMIFAGEEMRMIVPDTSMIRLLYEENDARIPRFFDDNNGVVTLMKFSSDYFVVNRYGELLLTAAELYLINSDVDKATELVNLIRNRADLDEVSGLSEAELWDVLKNERLRELFAEGYSFFDYMRWGETALRVPEITQEQVDAGIEWWPLSRESMSSFFNVSQNNYWK